MTEVGFTAQRRGPDGKPIGKRLTFLPDAFVIEPLRCCCEQTTSRLLTCPVHPKAGPLDPDPQETPDG